MRSPNYLSTILMVTERNYSHIAQKPWGLNPYGGCFLSNRPCTIFSDCGPVIAISCQHTKGHFLAIWLMSIWTRSTPARSAFDKVTLSVHYSLSREMDCLAAVKFISSASAPESQQQCYRTIREVWENLIGDGWWRKDLQGRHLLYRHMILEGLLRNGFGAFCSSSGILLQLHTHSHF